MSPNSEIIALDWKSTTPTEIRKFTKTDYIISTISSILPYSKIIQLFTQIGLELLKEVI